MSSMSMDPSTYRSERGVNSGSMVLAPQAANTPTEPSIISRTFTPWSSFRSGGHASTGSLFWKLSALQLSTRSVVR